MRNISEKHLNNIGNETVTSSSKNIKNLVDNKISDTNYKFDAGILRLDCNSKKIRRWNIM